MMNGDCPGQGLTAPSKVNPGQALLWFETGLALAKAEDSKAEDDPTQESDAMMEGEAKDEKMDEEGVRWQEAIVL
jgi:hypothetical protein